jgi:DNA-binding response OmpR family regulator
MENKKILLVEDALEGQLILQNILKGYDTISCVNLKEAAENLKLGSFAGIILDIELPDGDGLHFLAEFTELQKNQTAIFVISGKAALTNKAMAFTYGADDFITKPFDPIELKLRIDARIRKIAEHSTQPDHYKIEDLTVNAAEQCIYLESEAEPQPINFTSIEFRILVFFLKNKNKIISREEMIQHIWGNKVYITNRSVDAHVAHIRKKIQASRVKIETIFGTGYKLTVFAT